MPICTNFLYLQSKMDFDIVEMADYSGEKAHVYSVVPEGCDKTLLEQFVEDNIEYGSDVKNIQKKLYQMGHYYGFRRYFFKHNEGSLGDGMAVLKSGQLRLYCLYFDNTVVFFGSGGYKPPEIHAYQEDAKLNAKAQQMRQIAQKINEAVKNKDIVIENDGSLTINNWDYD